MSPNNYQGLIFSQLLIHSETPDHRSPPPCAAAGEAESTAGSLPGHLAPDPPAGPLPGSCHLSDSGKLLRPFSHRYEVNSFMG